MKTPEPPRSSKGKGKDEESASSGETPMERFRRTASVVVSVDPKKVKAIEVTKKRPKP